MDKAYLSDAGDGGAVKTLRERLSADGGVLSYGSEEWLARMKSYSPQGEQTPAYVIECATEEDVVHAVKFAVSLNLPVTARSGAHNLAELSNVQGGVVISQTKRVKVTHDLDMQTVTFEGGAQFRHVDSHMDKNAPGWVMQSAMISTIGITGSHFAVGVGWLQRKVGNGIDNIVSVRLVLADGSIAVASATENADLFFALRGAGPSYGIITEVTERIYNICDPDKGKEVRLGCFFFDLKDGEKLWEVISKMDNDPEFPDDAFLLPLFCLMEGKPGIVFWYVEYMYKNGKIDTETTKWEKMIKELVKDTKPRALAPNSLSPSTGDGWEFITHLETQALFGLPWMCSFYPTGGFVTQNNAAKVFLGVLEHWRTAKQPDGASEVPFHTTAFYHFGSKKQRNREITAWPGNSDTNWLCATWGGVLVDQDPAQRVVRRAQTKEWVDKLYSELRYDLQFGYICAAAYNWRSVNHARWIHGESFGKLTEVKEKYDPENVFKNNVNIPPKRLCL